MADVLIVCVREDEPQAKALADMFERAGFSVGGAPANDGVLRSTGAGVIVWSQASIRSRPFLDAAQRVIDAHKAVVASLIDPPPPHTVGNAPAFALNGWTGDPEDSALDPLFFAVDRMVNSQRAAVGAAGARPTPEPFQEPPSLRPPPPPAYARRPAPPPAAPPPRPAPPPSRPAMQLGDEPLSSETEHWRAIRDSRNPADFMDYLARYGVDGAFAEVAELKLKQLTGPQAPGANPLRDAARASAPSARQRRLETPPPKPEPPPQRRPEPPRYEPPRYEPPRYEANRSEAPRYEPPAYEPPRRPEPPREPQREPPRREPAYSREPSYARDYDRAPPPTHERARNGGLIRILVLALLLGGGAFAVRYFLQQQPAQQEQVQAESDAPPPGDSLDAGDQGASDQSSATPQDPVELAQTPDAPRTSVRAAPQPRPQPPRQQQQRTPAPAPEPEEDPTPPPQTSWSTTASASPAPAAGGPASLLNPTTTVAANTPPPQAAPAPVARPAPGMVIWTARPSPQRIANFFPERAERARVGGRADLQCVVQSTLTLNCTVLSETPGGLGFGRAAMQAASGYRAAPSLTNGEPAIGARTRLGIVFQAAPRN